MNFKPYVEIYFYAMAIIVAKHAYIVTIIVSARLCPAELFWLLRGLTHSDQSENVVEISVAAEINLQATFLVKLIVCMVT